MTSGRSKFTGKGVKENEENRDVDFDPRGGRAGGAEPDVSGRPGTGRGISDDQSENRLGKIKPACGRQAVGNLKD